MEIGLAVGGAFLSSALQVIGDRLAPKGEWLNIFQKQHDLGLLKKLRRTALDLQAVLDDAENKQSSNRSVREWLNELQDAAEDAENLLDEINYEALKLKVEARHQHSGETIQPQHVMISDQFVDDIMPRAERTVKALKDLEEKAGDLGLLKNTGSNKQDTPEQQHTTSVVDDSDVYGRKDETEQLISRVLLPVDADSEKPSVIPIVGLGGLGKTTLAKVVYNDPIVQGNFDLKAWVCVSEQYDAFKIAKALLREIIGSSGLISNGTLNQIQIKLKEKIKGKKFLFVLDDIWNNNYADWADLKSLFVQGKSGSKIIVTTRKGSVASVMGTDQPMNLKNLPGDESWNLFERHAFKNKELHGHPDFQEVGRNIALKCKGLPLALKTVAGLLCSKPGIEDWRNVLRSRIWEQSVSGVLPALHLSFNDLPRHLKRCFAHLAIFPKDFPFDRDYVVQLWIANGFVLQPQTDESIQDTGKQYFLELQSRSLIEKESGKFMMHGLVNDLALLVASELCLRLEDLQGSQCSIHLSQRARHLSYTIDRADTFKKFEVLCKMERLRALLSIDVRSSFLPYLSKRVLQIILPKLASLRALSLSHYNNSELPDTVFNELKQLRFLDLSSTSLTKLPNSTFKLYNLQTFLLSHCTRLYVLPSSFKDLISLRYLDIRDTPGIKIQANKWKFVNVLLGATIIIDKCDGTRFDELGDLQNLYGSLSISQLQNVGDTKEAEEAKLWEKEQIEELSLHWRPTESNDSQFEHDVLNKLWPSMKIRELKIDGYRGTKFPNWLGDPSFGELVKLSLENCNNCDSLPSLGQLPFLKSLSIIEMHGISILTEEFYGNDQSSMEPFQSLLELKFADMSEWKEWHVLGNREFPKLERLSIIDCPNLTLMMPEKLHSLKLSSFPSRLQELKVSGFENLDSALMTAFPKGGLAAPNLKKLELTGCFTLESLPEHMCDLLPSLYELMIYDCPEIECFPKGGLPFSLETLRIWNCEKLVNSQNEWHLQDLSNLRILHIDFDGSDEGIVAELPSTIQELRLANMRSLNSNALESLTSLQTLTIEDIPEIQSLLEEGIFLSLTSLQFLKIGDCEQLLSLPEEGLPSSLTSLSISNCPQLQSLPEKGLPSSLSKLTIYICRQLRSLPEKGLPSSLSVLTIIICPLIQSFPENGLPSTLSELRIIRCPLLESRLEFEKGVDWPKVAHIPHLFIGDELI